MCERQHLLKGWIKLFFSHSDSKCWALLNSFLFDLIIGSSSCSTLFPPHFFPPIPLSVCFSGGSCNPPAGKELPLSHSVSSFDLLTWILFNHSILLSLCSCSPFSLAFVWVTLCCHMLPFLPILHFSLVLWQVAVRLCKLNLGNWLLKSRQCDLSLIHSAATPSH